MSAHRQGALLRVRGFTLVELMVTIAVAAVLLAIAVPSFRSIILSNRLTTAANNIVDSIHEARLDAIKRNVPVQFCSNSASKNTGDTLGTKCGTSGGAVIVAVGSTVAAPISIDAPLKLNGDITPVRFSPNGMGYAPGTTTPVNTTIADICASGLSSDNHRIIKLVTGSIVTTTKATGSCQ
jgi:type IV fimbrial biogenesis protein FimT